MVTESNLQPSDEDPEYRPWDVHAAAISPSSRSWNVQPTQIRDIIVTDTVCHLGSSMSS